MTIYWASFFKETDRLCFGLAGATTSLLFLELNYKTSHFFLEFIPHNSYISLVIPSSGNEDHEMALLVGEFDTTIDAKHRLAINSALREQIDPDDDGRHFILVLGPDRHLWLYPDAYYRRLLSTMKRSPLPDRQTRRIDLLFAMARVVKPDAQGRIVLPEKSMQRSNLQSDVTLVGVYDHIEIWPSQQWQEHVEKALPDYGEMLYEAADRMNRQDQDEAK